MPDLTPTDPSSAQHMHMRIETVINNRAQAEANSPYDWKTALMAVSAARIAFTSVEVTGTAQAYQREVVAALERCKESYWDPDGECTSGKAEIGTIIERILSL